MKVKMQMDASYAPLAKRGQAPAIGLCASVKKKFNNAKCHILRTASQGSQGNINFAGIATPSQPHRNLTVTLTKGSNPLYCNKLANYPKFYRNNIAVT